MSSPSARSSMDLSAAAQEALGFADDQFMELSTSGASIYNISSLLTDPLVASSSSSGRARMMQADAAGGIDLSNSTLRRLFLSNTAAGARASRDESTLSMSGMSLASLGSLSRSKSSRWFGGLFDVDRALDDSRAWRNCHPNGAGLGESSSGRIPELLGEPGADGLLDHTGGSTAGVTADVAAGASRACSRGANGERESESGAAEGVRGARGDEATAAAAVAAAAAGNELPSPPACVDGRGRIQDLSQRVAELRKQSYHRRLMAVSAAPRSRTAPPPLPVGVDLAPPEVPAASSQPKLSPSGVPAVAEAGCGDSFLEGSCGVGRGMDSSDDSNRRAKRGGGRTRKVAAKFMRKIGLGQRSRQQRHQRQQQSEGVSVESSNSSGNNNHVVSTGVDCDGVEGGSRAGSVTTSCWSADSSLQGGGGDSKSAPFGRSISAPRTTTPSNSSALAAPAPLARSTSVGLRAYAEPSDVAFRRPSDVSADSLATAPAARSAAKRGGLRGRFEQVWNSMSYKDIQKQHEGLLHHHHHHQQEEGMRLGAGMGADSENRATCDMLPAVLQPMSGGDGGFAFLPRAAPLAGPEVTPIGSTPSNGGGTAHPTTPLARSIRSFDPNQPLSGSVDCWNVLLPPLFGTPSATNSLGASTESFDPNRSTRSWFDTSMESQGRIPPDVSVDLWLGQPPQQQQQQQQRRGVFAGLVVEPRAVPVTSRPWSESERKTAAAAAAGIALATASPTMGIDKVSSSAPSAATQPAQEAGADPAGAAIAPPPLDEDLLVAELSDLSVSCGIHRKGRGGRSVGVSPCNGGEQQQEEQGMWSEAAARADGGAVSPNADWSRPMQQLREALPGEQEIPPWTASGQGVVQVPPSVISAASAERTAEPTLGPAPPIAPAWSSATSPKAQSVGVGMLSHIPHPQDVGGGRAPLEGYGLDNYSGGDQHVSRSIGAWSHQGTSVDVNFAAAGSTSWDGLVLPSANLLQRSVSAETSVSDALHGSSRSGKGRGDRGVEGPSPQPSSRGAFQQEAEAGCFARPPPLDGDDSVRAQALSEGSCAGADGRHQQQQHQKSWSTLQAMIPLPGIPATTTGTPAGAGDHRRRFTVPLPASGGGDNDSRRPSLPMPLTSMAFADGKAALAGGGDAGSNDGEGVGGRLALSGQSSSKGSSPIFGQSNQPAGSGTLTLTSTVTVSDKMDEKEMLLKRRLHSSRALDISAHKKQCVDSVGAIGDAGDAAAADAAAAPGTTVSNGNTNTFEPFNFLWGRFGHGRGVSSSSSSSTMAITPSSSSVSIASKGELLGTAANPGPGSGAGGAVVPPLFLPLQKQKVEGNVNPLAKKARQEVAARRPRDRGRFMKSRQIWVTQGELKQNKTTATPADGQG